MPDGGTSEAVDDGGLIVAGFSTGLRVKKYACGTGGGLDLLGGALTDAFGLTIAPDIGGQDGLVAFIDEIAHGLADKMGGNGETFQAMFGEQCPFLFDVIGFGEGAVDFKMIAPTGEFDAVITHFFDHGRELSEGEVGPLAGEKSYGSGHGVRIIFSKKFCQRDLQGQPRNETRMNKG
jgi:hypothetical protein